MKMPVLEIRENNHDIRDWALVTHALLWHSFTALKFYNVANA